MQTCSFHVTWYESADAPPTLLF